MKRRTAVLLAVSWQCVVVLLALAGIFADLYPLLGIPWNSTRLINVSGTTLCWIIMELPLLAVLLLTSLENDS